MATNKIDYDVLEQASKTYSNEAAAIAEVLSKLDSVNSTLAEGWQNDTARAFIERYETEHKKHFRQLEILLQISQIILQGIARQKLKEMQVVLTLCEVS